jgi:hypothetical protein
MSDLLEDLRDADPVDRATLQIPPRLAARIADSRSKRSQPRGLAVVTVVAVAAAAVIAIVLGLGAGEGRLSLADQAYAATAGPGVRHWRISIRTFINGKQRGIVQHQEGWAHSGILHVLLFNGHRLTSDVRETSVKTRSWGAGQNDYIEVPTPKGGPRGPLQLGDPFAQFRQAHDAGRLVRVNATTYRMRPDNLGYPPAATLTYELDPRTALPARAVLAYTRETGPSPSALDGARYRVVFAYDSYQRLPDTATNRANLELLAHPNAGPSRTEARTVFAILRNGAPLTRKQHELIASFAKAVFFERPHFDIATARRGPHNVVLIAGDGYVGMMRHGGGTWATVDTAVKRGMAIGGGAVNENHSMFVVVPDGVRTVRARLPQHSWKTFRVRRNVVVLPSGGYHFKLVR